MSIHLHKTIPDGLTFSGSIAVDTETLGLKTTRDRLCLVQLSAGTECPYRAGDNCYAEFKGAFVRPRGGQNFPLCAV